MSLPIPAFVVFYYLLLVPLTNGAGNLTVHGKKILNCSNYIIESTSTCVCVRCTAYKCTICCSSQLDTTECWEDQQQVITVAQISMFILFLIGIIAVFTIFFKLLFRAADIGCLRYPIVPNVQNENGDCNPTQQQRCSGDVPRDPPPPYTEAYGAPPVYGSPTNRALMSEAPPVYPGTLQIFTTHHI